MVVGASMNEIIKGLADAGFHSTLRYTDSGIPMLVCVKFRKHGTLSGNHFFLRHNNGNWLITTTTSKVAYIFKPDTISDIIMLCCEVLRLSDNVISSLPESISVKYSLIEADLSISDDYDK